MRDGQSIDEMMQRIRAEARKDDAPAEDSAGERKPGDAPGIEPLSQALERLRRQSHPQQKQQPLAPAGGQVITPYARPGEVSKPRITPLQAENARTVTGVPYENAGTFTHLQYEVEVAVDSRDLVGKLNPRNAGLANLAAQSAKKFVQRSLSWYTRSLHHFQKAVAQALVHIQTLLKRHDESLASQQREMTAMREELEALRAEVRELRDRQRHGAGS